jgi:hypothetical protein
MTPAAVFLFIAIVCGSPRAAPATFSGSPRAAPPPAPSDNPERLTGPELGAHLGPRVQYSATAYVTQLDHVKIYQSFFPVVMTVEMPPIQPWSPLSANQYPGANIPFCARRQPVLMAASHVATKGPPKKSTPGPGVVPVGPTPLQNAACAAYNVTTSMIQQMNDYLSSNNFQGEYEPTPPTARNRNRRMNPLQWLGSTWLGFCCDAVSGDELNSVKEQVNTEDKAISRWNATIADSQAKIFKMADKYDAWGTETESFEQDAVEDFKAILGSMANNRQQQDLDDLALAQSVARLAHTTQRYIQHQTVENAHVACSSGFFPAGLVPITNLLTEISLLEDRLQGSGWKMTGSLEPRAIGQLPLTTCRFSGSKLTVRTRIPIVPEDMSTQIFKVSPVPFAYEGNICRLHLPITNVVKSSSGSIQELTKDGLCDKGLCRHFNVPDSATESAECLRALVSQGSPRDVLNNCEVRCAPGRKPVLHRIDERRVAIIHDQPLKLVCKESSGPTAIDLPVSRAGYTLTTSGCHCSTQTLDGAVLVPAVFPCSKTFLATGVQLKLPYFLVDPDHLEAIMDAPLELGSPNWANLSDIGLSAAAVRLTAHHFQPLKFSADDLRAVTQAFSPPPFTWSDTTHMSWFWIVMYVICAAFAVYVIIVIKLHHRHLHLGSIANPFSWVVIPELQELKAEEYRQRDHTRRSSRRLLRSDSPPEKERH